jgi:type IV pilus assembly protein PilY1
MKRAIVLLLFSAAVAADECDELERRPSPVEVRYSVDVQTSFLADAGGVRAVDVASGLELWRHDVPDGDITSDLRVLRFDANGDGVIDPAAGDRLWLYFGAGRSYVALDASERTRARLLWSGGPEILPGIGEAWSTPGIARIHVDGVRQDDQRFVILVGGGYSGEAGIGHRLFMLDAESGALLWSAGGPAGEGEPDLPLERMTYPIAARIAVQDTDGDAFTDRLYTADLGGQVWRFDVTNGSAPDALIAGGVLASLGGGAAEDRRQFFHPPDVALVRDPDGAWLSLAIGSGDRRAPLDVAVHDRFYSIRDRNPFTPLSQADYDAVEPVLDEQLVDVTDGFASAAIPRSAPGWKVDLRLHGGWVGEKVLTEATTLNGTILFTTYTPATCVADCTNRLYALQLEAGRPALDLDGDEAMTNADASQQLMQRGAPGELRIAVTPPVSTEESRALSRTRCWVGDELLPVCVSVARLRRIFWRRGVD